MKRDIFTRIIKDESGATAIEYGLIVALVAVTAMVGYKALGDSLNTLFGTTIKGKLDGAIPSS